jgi:hypothetical protein
MDSFVSESVAIAAEPACSRPGMDELGYLACEERSEIKNCS